MERQMYEIGWRSICRIQVHVHLLITEITGFFPGVIIGCLPEGSKQLLPVSLPGTASKSVIDCKQRTNQQDGCSVLLSRKNAALSDFRA